ncbi:MAG TPA: extracellular solute-binding protein [Phototrophicaceae bacterium]|nr:extracellular solute-binding protein [Phototrophicaceae bacterium]
MFKSSRLVMIVALVALLSLSIGAAVAQDKVEIDWWHIATQEDQAAYWQSLADAYMEANPNVAVNITILENAAFKQRLTTVMQAGDPPDLFQSWGGAVLWEYAANGLVRNIAPELEGDWRDSFAAQAALNLFGQEDETYGVPVSWGAVGMFYNKALFEQAGVEIPTTWAEFLTAVQTFKDAGITPIALGEGEKWPGHFWWVYLATQLGGEEAFLKAYSREGAFTDEPFVQAGEYLKELVDMEPFQEGFLGTTHPESEGVFGNGEAAMMLMGQWAPAAQAQYSEDGEGIGDDLGWFPFPAVEGGKGNPDDVFGGGDGFAVGANAPDEAVDFLKFLTNEESQRGSAFFLVPVVKNTADVFADDPVMQSILAARDAAPYFQMYYDQFLPPAVGSAVNDAVETIFAGVATPEEAAQAIEDSAAAELAQ